jgi:hypothetical protein
MRLAVIGSRTFQDYELLKETLDHYYITNIISGGDEGADKLVERYAEEKGLPIDVITHEENFEMSNSPRTYAIINNAQIVVAFWNGKSKGTGDMVTYAKRKNKQMKIIYFKEPTSN